MPARQLTLEVLIVGSTHQTSNNVLANYNNTVALNLTPAGQVLVQSGLFTAAQLGVGNSLCYNNPNNLPVNSLCAIAPPVPLGPNWPSQSSLATCPRLESVLVTPDPRTAHRTA